MNLARAEHFIQSALGHLRTTKQQLSIYVSLTIAIGNIIPSSAADSVLEGQIRLNVRPSNNKAHPTAAKSDANSKIKSALPSQSSNFLVNKYGSAANSQRVAAAIKHTEQNKKDKLASDRFESLSKGYMVPGTSPTELLMFGYLPPGMPPQQASLLYKHLPHLRQFHNEFTPQDISTMAREPVQPGYGFSGMQQIPESERQLNEQKWVESFVRQTQGPVSVPPLHRDPAWLAEHAHRNKDGSYTVSINNQLMPMAAQYAYDPGIHMAGSIREMTDSSGTIVAQFNYSPYGEPIRLQGSLTPDFLYGGYYFHAPSGLYLTLNRPYSPTLGRWITRDPIGEIGGVNLYGYLLNNPLSGIDPTGLFPCAKGPWSVPNRGTCPDGSDPVLVSRAAWGRFWLCRGDSIITPGRPQFDSSVDNAYAIKQSETQQATDLRHEQDIAKFTGMGNDVANAIQEAQIQHQQWKDSLWIIDPRKYLP